MILLISPGFLVLCTTDTLMLELDLTCSTPLFRRDRPSFVSKSATTHPERTFSLGSSFKVRYFKLWASDAALEAEDRTAYSSNLGRGNTASPKKSTYFALSGEIGRVRSKTLYVFAILFPKSQCFVRKTVVMKRMEMSCWPHQTKGLCH